jgi:hypothetical protein
MTLHYSEFLVFDLLFGAEITRVADTLRQQQDVGGLKKAKRDNRCLSLAAVECRTQAVGVMEPRDTFRMVSRQCERLAIRC